MLHIDLSYKIIVVPSGEIDGDCHIKHDPPRVIMIAAHAAGQRHEIEQMARERILRAWETSPPIQ